MSKEYDDNSDETFAPVYCGGRREPLYLGEQIESIDIASAYPLDLFFDLNNFSPES